MNRTASIPSAACITLAVLAAAMALPTSTPADEVRFTAGVPNGTTAFPNLVQFNVSNDDNQSPSYEVNLGAGLTGSQVAGSMKTEMDSFGTPQFPRSVSGNTLTVDTANNGYYLAPAEIGMTMEVDVDAGSLPDGAKLDLPFSIEQRPDYYIYAFIVAAADGSSIPAGATGRLTADLVLDGEPLSVDVSFEPDTTTAEINRLLAAEIDAAGIGNLRQLGLASWPAAYGLERPVDFSVNFDVESDQPPDFLVGALTASRIPEPTTVALLALGGGVVLLGRRIPCRRGQR